MDKDLIRIIIFAIGLAVIIGMIAWSYITHEKIKRHYGGYDDLSPDQENSNDDYDIHELEETDIYQDPYAVDDDDHLEKPQTISADDNVMQHSAPVSEAAAAIKKPAIIQFSIVSNNDLGFNGVDIFEILDDVGLEYGNLQIFERLDGKRLVDFGVASMVKPGTFPSTHRESFYTPGIVFFMQPSKLDHPQAVFDDFVSTFKFVATQLDGEMWDHERNPLTEKTIAQIRYSLGIV